MAKYVIVLIRVGVTFAVSLFSALVTAVALAVVDLYLTGHSLPSLGTTWIEKPRYGIALAPNDAILLGIVLIAGLAAWLLSGMLFRRKATDRLESPPPADR